MVTETYGLHKNISITVLTTSECVFPSAGDAHESFEIIEVAASRCLILSSSRTAASAAVSNHLWDLWNMSWLEGHRSQSFLGSHSPVFSHTRVSRLSYAELHTFQSLKTVSQHCTDRETVGEWSTGNKWASEGRVQCCWHYYSLMVTVRKVSEQGMDKQTGVHLE